VKISTQVQDEENKDEAESLPDKEEQASAEEADKPQKPRISKRSIKMGRKSYNVDGDDDEYFEILEQGHLDERGLKIVKTKEQEETEEARIGREHQARAKGSFL